MPATTGPARDATRAMVDPDYEPLIDMFPELEFSADLLPMMRDMLIARFQAMALGTAPAGDREIAPGANGGPDVSVLIHRPNNPAPGSLPAVLYIHGGGFVIGDAAMMATYSTALANAIGGIVASVDYRLAPEAPFPGPLDDCWRALRWLVDEAARFGIDPARIVVLGDSAGGGLAAALALLARDRGGPSIAGQVLIYPMIDHRTGTPDAPVDNPMTGTFVWSRSATRFGWDAMRGDYGVDDERIGYFSPARAADLKALPRTFIGVGALDLFVEENVDYALRLMRAGVPVELAVIPGVFHGFDRMPGAASSRFRAQVVDAIKRMTA